ncbi:hypothetical protein Tsubulata_038105 [Turnera subulata]|uniref:Uncharacterized protein n=1 Tax=Turnera subulata TaxID=218843 RepID=A0A9Q0FN35_9ROSI|nr:hypothetical protein Tsubulata_038105 [Turnera subulata]
MDGQIKSDVAATAEVEEAESGDKDDSFSNVENPEDQVVHYVQLEVMMDSFQLEGRDSPWPPQVVFFHQLLQ